MSSAGVAGHRTDYFDVQPVPSDRRTGACKIHEFSRIAIKLDIADEVISLPTHFCCECADPLWSYIGDTDDFCSAVCRRRHYE